MTEHSLLEAAAARIDVDGVPALEELSLALRGDHALVLGAPRALFEAATGVRPPAHGQVLVLGDPARRAVEEGILASAPLDPPLPLTWSAREYVTWSARLAGHGRKDAAGQAGDALERLGLRKTADTDLRSASPMVRRLVVIAGAVATGARVLFLEDPSASIEGDAGSDFADTILRGLDGCSWVVFAPRIHANSPWMSVADEALVIAGSTAVAQGKPDELAAQVKTYALDVLGEAPALSKFVEVILARGGRVQQRGRAVTVDLAENFTTADLFVWAYSAEATILALRPIGRAFS